MELSFYTGPIAQRLGTDIAWLPGLLLPGAIYIVAERARERRATASAAG
jgi:nucleobase:cation symporter-1, NCS1 family